LLKCKSRGGAVCGARRAGSAGRAGVDFATIAALDQFHLVFGAFLHA